MATAFVDKATANVLATTTPVLGVILRTLIFAGHQWHGPVGGLRPDGKCADPQRTPVVALEARPVARPEPPAAPIEPTEGEVS